MFEYVASNNKLSVQYGDSGKRKTYFHSFCRFTWIRLQRCYSYSRNSRRSKAAISANKVINYFNGAK